MQKKSSDIILYADKYFIIKPTLGSVAPLYILFIPEKRFVNFAQTAMSYRIKPIPLIARILSEKFSYNGKFIWFEHGATTPGAVAGSDIDHGHTHILF